MQPVVYCADIGSVKKGNFAWARGRRDAGVTSEGREITRLASGVAEDLSHGSPVALGFECPLFVPLPRDPTRLTAARHGEGMRAWSAGGGAGALVTGLTEVTWTLQEVRRLLSAAVPAFVDWAKFEAAGTGLYLWEALISSEAKGESHIADARIGVTCFLEASPNPPAHNAIQEENVYSLVGAALLRTGWSSDLSLLALPCLVIKARHGANTVPE